MSANCWYTFLANTKFFRSVQNVPAWTEVVSWCPERHSIRTYVALTLFPGFDLEEHANTSGAVKGTVFLQIFYFSVAACDAETSSGWKQFVRKWDTCNPNNPIGEEQSTNHVKSYNVVVPRLDPKLINTTGVYHLSGGTSLIVRCPRPHKTPPWPFVAAAQSSPYRRGLTKSSNRGSWSPLMVRRDVDVD